VIEGATSTEVTLADGTTYEGKIIGTARDKDLAVIKIDAPPSKLSKIMIGTSADLQVGQKVLAIGNPFGLDQTLTTGVISGLGREIMSKSQRKIYDVIQTDAPINPGNSGGPLLDGQGRLIGVNTAIYSAVGRQRRHRLRGAGRHREPGGAADPEPEGRGAAGARREHPVRRRDAADRRHRRRRPQRHPRRPRRSRRAHRPAVRAGRASSSAT
jgi:hypothetical protein